MPKTIIKNENEIFEMEPKKEKLSHSVEIDQGIKIQQFGNFNEMIHALSILNPTTILKKEKGAVLDSERKQAVEFCKDLLVVLVKSHDVLRKMLEEEYSEKSWSNFDDEEAEHKYQSEKRKYFTSVLRKLGCAPMAVNINQEMFSYNCNTWMDENEFNTKLFKNEEEAVSVKGELATPAKTITRLMCNDDRIFREGVDDDLNPNTGYQSAKNWLKTHGVTNLNEYYQHLQTRIEKQEAAKIKSDNIVVDKGLEL